MSHWSGNCSVLQFVKTEWSRPSNGLTSKPSNFPSWCWWESLHWWHSFNEADTPVLVSLVRILFVESLWFMMGLIPPLHCGGAVVTDNATMVVKVSLAILVLILNWNHRGEWEATRPWWWCRCHWPYCSSSWAALASPASKPSLAVVQRTVWQWPPSPSDVTPGANIQVHPRRCQVLHFTKAQLDGSGISGAHCILFASGSS